MKPGRYWIKLCLICCLSIWLWGAPASSFAQSNATQTPIYTLEPRSDAAKTLATQANELYRTQDYKSALAKIQEALDKDPNSYKLHNLYVDIQLMLVSPDRVRQEYFDKMAKDPANPVFPLILARNRVLLIDREAIQDLLEKAGTVAPDSVVGQSALIDLYRFHKEDLVKTEEAYKKAIALDPNNHEMIASLAAFQVEELKKFDEALALYQSLLKQNPKNYEAAIGVMSVNVAKAGYSDKAKAAMRQELTALKTSEPPSQNLLSAIRLAYWLVLKDQIAAQEITKELNEKFPTPGVPPGLMGISMITDTGEPLQYIFAGRRYFWIRKVQAIDADQKTPLADRITKLETLNQENPDDEQFRAYLLEQLVRLYKEAKDTAKQEATVKQILAIEPRKVGLLNDLAWSLTAGTRPDQEKALTYAKLAIAELEKLTQGKGYNQQQVQQSKASFLETLGRIQFQLDNLSEAEAALTQSLALNHTDDANYELGRVYEKQGKTREAAQIFAESVASEGDNSAMARKRLEDLDQADTSIHASALIATATEKRISRLREKVIASLVTKPSKDFTLTSFDGKKVNLASLKGKVVMLNFWASW
ncbi:MAG: tetratricopeptide repeat protein [Acidobacteria bacterium]|nr:tetratricopeptide repeat protein [Acidobacteriota bacterium]